MRTVNIIGDNGTDNWTKTRIACRGVIIKDGMILLSHETVTGWWMIPGGGKDEGETDFECVKREVAEETGYEIEPSEAVLEINEYLGEWKWVNRYFFCRITGNTQMKLTEREFASGHETRWVSTEEAFGIFETYRDYPGDVRETLHYRELTALNELLKP